MLAVEQRDLLGVLAHAHQIEAEIGFVALLLEIERDQRPADQMGERGSDDRVDQRRPEQITRDSPMWSRTGAAGAVPDKFHRITAKEPSVTTEFSRLEADRQNSNSRRAGIDELLDVLGNALIGIVGGVTEQLHAVVIGVGQPMVEIGSRQPAPPADL